MRSTLAGPYTPEAIHQARQRVGLDIGGDAKARCEEDDLVVCPGPITPNMVMDRQYDGCETTAHACHIDPGAIAANVQVGEGDMERHIPLTRTQVEALGIDPGDQIGCGAFACVYAHRSNPKLAVKITHDEDDASALHKMQGDPKVVRVHQAFELQRNGMPSGYYALVVDRLKPLPKHERITLNFWNNAVGGVPGFTRHAPLFESTRRSRTFNTGRYRLPPAARKRANEFCGDERRMEAEEGLVSRHTQSARCAKLTSFTLRVHEAAGRRGIRFVDPSGTNIMRDDKGKLLVSDMGYSWAGRHAPTMLARARARGLRGRSRKVWR